MVRINPSKINKYSQYLALISLEKDYIDFDLFLVNCSFQTNFRSFNHSLLTIHDIIKHYFLKENTI